MAKIWDLTVNGRVVQVEALDDEPLLNVLREGLGLTGAKYACGEGRCGACTVLVDGAPRRSCTTTIAEIASRPITTIEGLAKDGALHPVQQAFLEAGALQCGYCTSGLIMQTIALFQRFPKPSEDTIRRFLEGNLCRCGTYTRVLSAVQAAAQAMAGKEGAR